VLTELQLRRLVGGQESSARCQDQRRPWPRIEGR
jgi:hypothetical protein